MKRTRQYWKQTQRKTEAFFQVQHSSSPKTYFVNTMKKFLNSYRNNNNHPIS